MMLKWVEVKNRILGSSRTNNLLLQKHDMHLVIMGPKQCCGMQHGTVNHSKPERGVWPREDAVREENRPT